MGMSKDTEAAGGEGESERGFLQHKEIRTPLGDFQQKWSVGEWVPFVYTTEAPSISVLNIEHSKGDF